MRSFMATWPCYTTWEWQMQMASYVFQEAGGGLGSDLKKIKNVGSVLDGK